MQPGIRVIRGPDWCHGNQDGGVGFLGTVVKHFHDNTVKVTWDVGVDTVCRAGLDDAFDLRVFDNGQIGVNHSRVECDIVPSGVYGIRWKCLVCRDYDECTNCYMGIQTPVTHDSNHPFVRFTTEKATVVRVPPRRNSRRIPIYGIFPGSKVTKVEETSDSTENVIGVVEEIVDIQNNRNETSYRGAAKVKWLNKDGSGRTIKDSGRPERKSYRLGADGDVELKLLEPVSPGHVFIDHLPILDLTRPVDVEFSVGDTVRVDLNVDTFKSLHRLYGESVDDLEQALGEEGTIESLNEEIENLATIQFHRIPLKAPLFTYALTKVVKTKPCDTEEVTDDKKTTKELQNEGESLPRVNKSEKKLRMGHVSKVNKSNEAHVDVDGGMVNVGIRVVRGPDWSSDFEDQDGGEGHLGSLVEVCGLSEDDMYPKDCVVVQWDNGERNVYRAGYEKAYDLRVFDNAGVGIKHEKSCTECSMNNVLGFLWTCSQCSDVTLCSLCYGEDKHDINHGFIRHEHPGDSGVPVPKRAMSRKVVAKGIFEKSKVRRGPDWRWQNQDGGDGKQGEVIAIVNFSPETDHDAAEVTWQNGYTNVYRLGYKGRQDLKCVKPVRGGFYYRDHMPILKLDQKSANPKPDVKKENQSAKPKPEVITPVPGPSKADDVQQKKPDPETKGSDAEASAPSRFKNGDRVKIEIDVDILKMMEENRGAWNEHMTECIGKKGHVIVSKGVDVTVDFADAGRFTFHESVLNKVKEFHPGDIVQVKDSVDHVRMLQTERGGWNEMIVKVVGRRGTVEEIDEDGDVMVSFGGYTWTLNPECLLETDGQPEHIEHIAEDSEDGQTPAIPSVTPDRPSSSKPGPSSEDEKLEEFFGMIFAGESDRVKRIIQRDPQLMLMDLKGQFAIHKAAQCGNIDIATTLFEAAGVDNQLEVKDTDDNTPMLLAVHEGHLDMVEYLVVTGCNKDAMSQNQESAVHIAVTNNNLPMLRKMKTLGFDVNLKNALQQSPLFDAISGDNVNVLTTVLGWPDVDVKSPDSIGFTPFASACRKGNKRAVLAILEIAPGELNRQKEDGFAGLHVAVLNNKIDIVRTLISQPGININLATKTGRTPLHIASEECHLDIVRLLIGKGADVTLVDRSGKTCLHVCAESTNGSVRDRPTFFNLVKYLLENGVPLDLKDSSGKLAVDYVVSDFKEDFPYINEPGPRGPSGANPPPTPGRPRSSSGADSPQTTGRPRGSSDADFQQTSGRPGGSSDADSKQTSGRPRGSSVDDPPQSLPANFGSTGRQDVPAGPGSLSIPNKAKQPPASSVQAPTHDDIDPELCESCDEEPIRFRLEPCRHLVCSDCRPAKKAKKKLCNFCGEPVAEVVEFDPR